MPFQTLVTTMAVYVAQGTSCDRILIGANEKMNKILNILACIKSARF